MRLNVISFMGIMTIDEHTSPEIFMSMGTIIYLLLQGYLEACLNSTILSLCSHMVSFGGNVLLCFRVVVRIFHAYLW